MKELDWVTNPTIDWNKYPNFSALEFDNGGPEPKEELVSKLQKARNICKVLCKEAGYDEIAFVINSGSRSKEHNKKVGGVSDSNHLDGLAVDLSARFSRKRFFILKALFMAGFKRIGIGNSFFHVDIGGKGKDEYVSWHY